MTIKVLRVRGPAFRFATAGHPVLEHFGKGDSLWTVGLDAAGFAQLTATMTAAKLDWTIVGPTMAAKSFLTKYAECQACAFFDPLSKTTCGWVDWDEGTKEATGSVAACHALGIPGNPVSLSIQMNNPPGVPEL